MRAENVRPPHPALHSRQAPTAIAQRMIAADASSDLFVAADKRYKAGYRPIAPIPESCIEGAEYIIQCIASGKLLKWKENQTRRPHVFAIFGGGQYLNISNTPNVHNYFGGLKSYPFTELPQVGQGIVIANSGADTGGYNMHFGAVVARAGDGSWCVISNVSEVGVVALIDDWPMLRIGDVADFKTLNGYTQKKYVLGLLST